MKIIRKHLLKRWLKNYHILYEDGKTPTAQDVAEAIVLDLEGK